MLPITLAAFDGGAIFFFIMIAVAGFINWLGEQKKKKAAEDAARRPGTAPERPNRPIPTGESEEERLRRFLEALGVPGDAPRPAPPRPQQPAPVPVPRAILRPAPKPAPRHPAPVVRPVQPRVFQDEPEPAESRDPGRLEEPASAIESIAGQFAAMEKGVQLSALDAIPEARTARTAQMAPVQAVFDSEQAPVRQGAGQAAAVRGMLRTAEDLRKAFILREILGPPPGLQS